MVFPALQLTCSNNCMHYHFRSYQNALYKVNVKKKFYLYSLKVAIKTCYNMSKEYQQAFRTCIYNLSNCFLKFANSVLLIFKYNFELLTKRDSVLQAYNNF